MVFRGVSSSNCPQFFKICPFLFILHACFTKTCPATEKLTCMLFTSPQYFDEPNANQKKGKENRTKKYTQFLIFQNSCNIVKPNTS